MANFTGDWITPDLARVPALASDVANSTNPAGSSVVVSHAIKTVTVANAVNDNAESNGTQSFWARLGHTALNGLGVLAKPLHEVQKDYKFLHSVYTDHGNLEGFVATLGIIGGGVGGFFLGGPAGALIGADLAAVGEYRMAKRLPQFKDSIAKSEDENYKVSPGRDFSNALGQAVGAVGQEGWKKALLNTNSGAGQVVSGIGDLTFDIKADPIMIMGNYAKLMRDGKMLKQGGLEVKYPLANAIPAIKTFVVQHSRVPMSAEHLDELRIGNVSYNRALDDIAQIVKDAPSKSMAAGNIAVKYPQLQGAAGRLAEFNNANDVHQFMKTSMFVDEMDGAMGLGSVVPTRGLLKATIGDMTVAKALADKIQRMPAGKYTGDVALDAPLLEKLKNAPDLVMGSMKNLPGNLYKTFTGYMPYSIDQATGKLSNTQFRWNAPDAVTVVYRIGKGGGLGEIGAREFAGKYAEAVAAGDINAARVIKNQVIFEAFKAIGLPEESQYVQKMYEAVHNVDVPKFSNHIYEVDENGNPLGAFDTAGGERMGGLYPRHTSEMWNIPDLIEAKAAMRQYGKISKQYSKFDDFYADMYTKKIFKPLALANIGFALRVTASEIIPAVARFGVTNLFKAGLGKAAVKAQHDLIPGESKHIFSAVLTGLGAHMGISPDWAAEGFPAFKAAKALGLNRAAKMLAPEQLEVATRIMMQNDAHILKEANAAGHNSSSIEHDMATAANYYHQVKEKSSVFKDSPEWTIYSKENPHYLPVLVSNINKASRSTPEKLIAQDIYSKMKYHVNSPSKLTTTAELGKQDLYEQFQALKEDATNAEYERLSQAVAGNFKPYDADVQKISRIKNGELRSMAQDRVSGVLGKVIGSDGTFHPDILKNIMEGRSTSIETIRAKYDLDPASLPKGVAGPVMLEPPAKGMFTKIIDIGFKKALDPIVNNLSREPLYVIHVADELKALDSHVANKWLTNDQALSIAQQRAVVKMMPQIHNTSLRSNFAQTARNFLPFYFAQEQALKRAYSAMKDTSVLSPVFSSTMRLYQLAEHGLSNPAFVETDDSGNKYIYMPMQGAFGEAAQKVLSYLNMPMFNGLPMSIRGNTTSLKSVLPELATPGVSPFLAISGNAIASIFPEAKSVVKGTIGDVAYNRGFADTIFPSSWMKNLWHGLTDNEKDVALGNAMLSAMAAAANHGMLPSANATDQQKQDFIDKIHNNAKSVLIIKGFLGLLSPLAPRVEQEDPGLRDEFWKLVKSKGNFADALIAFMNEHGSNSVSYTVARSDNKGAKGAQYPIVQKTLDFYNEHKDTLFKSYGAGEEDKSVSTGAFFLIPQDSTAKSGNMAVYSEMVRMGLRSQRTPEEMMKAMYISQGWSDIDTAMKAHVAAQQQFKANYDTYDAKLESANWSAILKKMENINPIWYKSYSGGEGKVDAQIAYNQLLKIYRNKMQPNNDQAKFVGNLLNDYSVHAATLAQYKQYGISGYVVDQENTNWKNHLDAVQVNQPQLDAVIKSVFSKLD